MSWDAELKCDCCGSWLAEANYTHNTNEMIAHAMQRLGIAAEPTPGPLGKAIGPSWWKHLDGMGGAEGAAFLRQIVEELEADPATYDAMNPENGWGSRAVLVMVLTQLYEGVPESPATWRVSG